MDRIDTAIHIVLLCGRVGETFAGEASLRYAARLIELRRGAVNLGSLIVGLSRGQRVVLARRECSGQSVMNPIG